MKYKHRIIQVLPTLAYGDGVGNDTLAIDKILKKQGIDTCIYASNIDKRIPQGVAKYVKDMPQIKKKDIILYHFSTGSELNEALKDWNAGKIMIYHNVTPPEFFKEYSRASESLCSDGRKSLASVKDAVDYCIADSEYNKKELKELGYTCPVDVLPIIIPFEDYQKPVSEKVIEKYSGDGYTNILFTGRISPNKKQEDIIEAFYYYQKYYNPKSRLFLVGSYQGMEAYYDRLVKYTEKLGAENVIFTGHIPFDEILAYYKLSDIFLCLSEHEGFCIPLVEAMLFKLPIMAYQDTGVTGTMGEGGLPIKEKNPLEIAGILHYIQTHEDVKSVLIEKGQEQLQKFNTERIEAQLLAYLEAFVKNKH